MTRVKFCGITRPEEIAAVNRLGPDLIGFVFAPGSRRQISPEQARALKQQLAPGIRAVGVFVRQPVRWVAALAGAGIIGLVQLHGGEPAAYLEALRRLAGVPVMQACDMSSPAGRQLARQSPADLLLLDCGPGGTGVPFDWGSAAGLSRPYFLAGGLGAHNVAEAIRRLHPYGVDVSSGIETGGRKDPDQMAAFLAAVRKEEKL